LTNVTLKKALSYVKETSKTLHYYEEKEASAIIAVQIQDDALDSLVGTLGILIEH